MSKALVWSIKLGDLKEVILSSSNGRNDLLVDTKVDEMTVGVFRWRFCKAPKTYGWLLKVVMKNPLKNSQMRTRKVLWRMWERKTRRCYFLSTLEVMKVGPDAKNVRKKDKKDFRCQVLKQAYWEILHKSSQEVDRAKSICQQPPLAEFKTLRMEVRATLVDYFIGV